MADKSKMREVIYAQLHSTVFLPGAVGREIESTLPSRSRTYKSFEMYWEDGQGLYLFIDNKEALIPYVNVKVVEFKKL